MNPYVIAVYMMYVFKIKLLRKLKQFEAIIYFQNYWSLH